MFVAAFMICASAVSSTDSLVARDLAPFAHLDANVRALPMPTPRTFATVAKGLEGVSKSPLERARAAYVWTTAHVVYSLEGHRTGTAALAALAGDCDAHSAIFSTLCKALQVECATVDGQIRFAVPPTGSLATEAKPLGAGQSLVSHAWNAIRIDGRWGLVDTTMGVKATKDAAEADDYFLADPAVFATDHVPTDAAMRLADAPADLARTPLLRPLAWRMGFGAAEFAPNPKPETAQVVLCPHVGWRSGMRAVLQTQSGGFSDATLVQPTPEGTEIRLCPTGATGVAWLGIGGTGASWHPLVGYPVAGTAGRLLPKVMTRFYDTGASLEGPFERDLAAGKPTEIRLRAPGASQVVAFQGQDLAGSFTRQGDTWILKTQPSSGAALEVMASYDDPTRFQGLVTYDVR